MAAIGIHIARVKFVGVNPLTGAVIDKNSPDTTIKAVLVSEHQHRIIADLANAPSSGGNPTVPDYLIAEAALGYVLRHMDQNMIITYPTGS